MTSLLYMQQFNALDSYASYAQPNYSPVETPTTPSRFTFPQQPVAYNNRQPEYHPLQTPARNKETITPSYQMSPSSPTTYSLISREHAEVLVAMLNQNQQFVESRKGHIQKQVASRENGKADVVSEKDCLDFSGEKSPAFAAIVSKLGIFQSNPHKEPFVLYKKVPRTSMQQKRMLETDDEFLVYLFSRWMNVDSESVSLIREPKMGNDEFKVWTSLETINIHGSYCQMFVVASAFNRHLFHRELL